MTALPISQPPPVQKPRWSSDRLSPCQTAFRGRPIFLATAQHLRPLFLRASAVRDRAGDGLQATHPCPISKMSRPVLSTVHPFDTEQIFLRSFSCRLQTASSWEQWCSGHGGSTATVSWPTYCRRPHYRHVRWSSQCLAAETIVWHKPPGLARPADL